jgi:hypothetical protein
MKRGRWTWALDCVFLLLLCAMLIRPWWKAKYLDNWGSIESTFIADARMLRDHWPRPLWQPFWYVGTRFDYVYPPLLRYGTAALAKYYPMDPAKAYHLYTGFFYCFGIAAVYVLARVGSRRRSIGLASGILAATVSPSYPFFPHVFADGFPYGTTKLNALVRYGEGPHMTALAWLPLALAFAWLALERKSHRWGIASGICCAMVVGNNFYGATALAMLFPAVVWAWMLRERDWKIVRFAAVPPLVAYGLSAFWLTPEYLEITLRNMQYVSDKGNRWSLVVALIAMVGFLSISNRLDRRRKLEPWWVFVVGSAGLFTLNSVGNQWLKFRILGEPMRLLPELDILLIFVLTSVAVLAWGWKGILGRGIVIAAALGLLGTHYNYLRHHRAIFPVRVEHKDVLYYRIPAWIAANYPDSRSYVTGAVRFWFNAWNDLAQLGGSSEQGLQNQTVMPSQWEIVMGEEAEIAILWLQVMGVDLVATHGPKSKEWYHDFSYPSKFEGKLKAVYDDGEENRIYDVPRRYRSLARVVNAGQYAALPKEVGQSDLAGLRKVAAVVENGPAAPTQTAWRGTDSLDVKGSVGAGQKMVVQVTYDPQWKASSNKGELAVHRDLLGFMVIDTPEGVDWIRLDFRKPLSKSVGEILFVLTLCVMGWVLWRERTREGA